ncbi:dihydrofolate reductase [Lachnospiraceae bacterium A10]|jgi:dihydrofolate reductase|nr:dihydrofolate reductase [Lachnospiraceae bacterium A10]
MKLIAAVDNNWGIGNKNQLLVSIPEDMKFFRDQTTGNVIVMGRKTLESFPAGRPLPNRTNIVLTRNEDYEVRGAIVVHNEEELMEELKKYDSDDIYIIGGESIYNQFVDKCDLAYITKIDYEYEADAHFPNLDEKPNWKLVKLAEEETYFDVIYHFSIYQNQDLAKS